MSLLLEALKQAELRKREPDAPQRTPPPRPEGPPAALELEIEGEAPPAPAAAVAATGPRPAPPAAFAMPQPEAAPPAPPRQAAPRQRPRLLLWLLPLALATSVVIAWLAMTSAPAPTAPVPPADFPNALPANLDAGPETDAAAPPQVDAPVQVDTPAPVAVPAASATPQPAAPSRAERPVRVENVEPAARVANNPPSSPVTATDQAVTVVPSRRDSPLGAAYAALRRGEMATAKTLYREVLSSEPAQIDALLGLATIAEWQGEWPAAAESYRQALAQDPRNAFAWAGLSRLGSDAAGPAVESQLRSLIAEQPAAPLYFALGNLLAADQRWADAQAAYFEAFAAAPTQADYAFNLAVALERLGQARPAADYYRRALALAEGGSTAAFDTESVRSRLAGLDPDLP